MAVTIFTIKIPITGRVRAVFWLCATSLSVFQRRSIVWRRFLVIGNGCTFLAKYVPVVASCRLLCRFGHGYQVAQLLALGFHYLARCDPK